MSDFWLGYLLVALVVAYGCLITYRVDGGRPASLDADEWLLICFVAAGWLPGAVVFVLVFMYEGVTQYFPILRFWGVLTKEFGDE